MSDWIDLSALWRIVVVGLLAGAGLPALFAVGLRALGPGTPEGPSGTTTANPLGIALATVCFAAVLAGIGWGIFFIVDGS